MSKSDTLSLADTLVTPPPSAEPLPATLAATPTGDGAGQLSDPGGELVLERSPDERYEHRALLGEGGMGEVRLCKDKRFGRDVAMKVVRSGQGSKGDLRARFLREARVQGQLEHPAIVPVYDVGRDAAGNLFFTMKRLRGSTLEEVITRLRSRDSDTGALYTRHKLLSAFLDVCQAVHFAHARGVVHRDLKPGNVMLGSYGEVYVLDWGLAKLTGRKDELQAEEQVDLSSVAGAKTAVGALMGTPGYMAPEQIAGDNDGIDHRTDVYALGVILFEILALQPLHGEGSASEVLARTLRGSDARPSVRAPEREVPPELEAICVRATAARKEDRYASARELHDAVERFLSGDRDLERRREMALDHVRRASEAAARAQSDAGTLDDRREALREVGRALALDPSNTEAVDVFVRLTSQPPKEIPKEVADQLAHEESLATQNTLRTAASIYLAWFLFIPLVYCMSPRNPGLHVAFNLLWLTVAASCWYYSRKPVTLTLWRRFPMLVLSAAGVSLASFMFGPFILVPTLAAVQTIGAIASTPPTVHRRLIALGCATVVAPFALQILGWIPEAYRFDASGMLVLPYAVAFPRELTLAFLLTASLSMIIGGGAFALKYQRNMRRAQQQSALMTWQLRQLAPAAGKALSSAPPPEQAACAVRELLG
jgi:serine/threonine-protein kinase